MGVVSNPNRTMAKLHITGPYSIALSHAMTQLMSVTND